MTNYCDGSYYKFITFNIFELNPILSYEIERLLSNTNLEPFTKYTLTDKEQINEHLQTVREQGYSIDDEEIELGLKCVAAPIFNHHGKVIAAISCATPKMRLDDEKLAEVIMWIKQAAANISESIGYKANTVLM